MELRKGGTDSDYRVFAVILIVISIIMILIPLLIVYGLALLMIGVLAYYLSDLDINRKLKKEVLISIDEEFLVFNVSNIKIKLNTIKDIQHVLIQGKFFANYRIEIYYLDTDTNRFIIIDDKYDINLKEVYEYIHGQIFEYRIDN